MSFINLALRVKHVMKVDAYVGSASSENSLPCLAK